MPMTFTQASTKNIVNSIRDFLETNVKPNYDNKAIASASWTQPLEFVIYAPDDPSVLATIPSIAIELPYDVKGAESTGLGDQLVWRHKEIHLYCYPGVDTNGKPSIESAQWLETCVDYALGTALTIPINDYSNFPTVTNNVDFAYVQDARLIRPVNKIPDALAIERHRFDYLLTIRYSVTTING